MGLILKTTGIVSLIIGVQLIDIQIAFTSLHSPNSVEIAKFDPPNDGGPETSQGAGTR